MNVNDFFTGAYIDMPANDDIPDLDYDQLCKMVVKMNDVIIDITRHMSQLGVLLLALEERVANLEQEIDNERRI